LTIDYKKDIQILNIHIINKNKADDYTSTRVCNPRYFDETREAWI
jgi:hypothetical protein